MPQVSVNYASDGGNGVVGLGASLSGLSSITRCSRTIAQDGVTQGAVLSSNDQLCLGGQRLVLVSGSHGAVGAEYRTEIESFQKIVITNSNTYPSGDPSPLSFTVFNKGGGSVNYGLTDNTRISDPDTDVVHSWQASQLQDVHGNSLTFEYADLSAIGSHGELEIERVPHKISYGGNTGQAISHHLHVQFEYENRLDSSHSFLNGLGFKQTQRLKKIRTIAGTEDVRNYHFAYETSASSALSRLTSIQECAGSSGTNDTCLPPTQIRWHTPNQTWSSDTTWSAPDALFSDESLPRGALLDINADGYTDWITAVTDSNSVETLQTWLHSDTGWENGSLYSPPASLGKNYSNGSKHKLPLAKRLT